MVPKSLPVVWPVINPETDTEPKWTNDSGSQDIETIVYLSSQTRVLAALSEHMGRGSAGSGREEAE